MKNHRSIPILSDEDVRARVERGELVRHRGGDPPVDAKAVEELRRRVLTHRAARRRSAA